MSLQSLRLPVGVLAALIAMTGHVDTGRAQDRAPFELGTFSPVVRQTRVGLQLAVGLDLEEYRQLRPHSSIVLRQFPLGEGDTVDLALEPFSVTDATTRIVVGTARGDIPVPHPDVILLRGHVIGEERTSVFLGLSAAGGNGLIRRGNREYVLRPPSRGEAEQATATFLVYERSAPGVQSREGSFHCLTRANAGKREPLADTENLAGAYLWRTAWVAIDCDYEYGQLFDDLTEATVYAVELLGAISSIYERDLQVRLHIPYLRVWSTTNDPYTADNVQVLLSDLTSHWKLNMGWVHRDIVHLLSGEPGRAGLANVDVLCDEDFGYGVSAGLIGAFPRPVPLDDGGLVDTFDIKIVAHEMGHQFGSPHTHCYAPSIDYCGQSFDDCWSGIFQCQQGTLMSYCDRTECIGISGKDLRFHERVITRIRQSVDASCLKNGMDPVYVDWANSTGIENGSSVFPFNTVLESLQVVVPGGTLQIDAGIYPERIVANRPTILRTTGGAVRIGP